VPARPAHLHPTVPDRDALLGQQFKRSLLETDHRSAVGPDHPPPADCTAVVGHHAADLARSARADKLRDVAVAGHLPSWDRLHRPQHRLDELLTHRGIIPNPPTWENRAVPEPMIEIRRADGRFETRTDWLSSRSSFSFGRHYDPDNVGFGPLVVHNHELVGPGTGFDSHPHADAEIVSWVLSGGLVHQDSQGHSGIVYPGLAQRMSAGSGILHSERNDAYRATDGWRIEPDRVVAAANYVQMWILPDESGLESSYGQREVSPDDLAQDWLPVASGSHPDASITINSARSTLWTTIMKPGPSRTLPAAGPRVHLYVARGAITIEEVGGLVQGDAVRITGAEPLLITATTDAELLAWEFTGEPR